MEANTEDTNRPIAVKSAQECVVVNDKVGILNTGNHDVGSDDTNIAVDTSEIIPRIKPELLSRLKSVATGAA